MKPKTLLILGAVAVIAWLYLSDSPTVPDGPDGDLTDIAAEALEGRESDGWFYAALYGRLADRVEAGAIGSRGELIDTTVSAVEISGIEPIGEEFGDAAFGDLGGPGPVDDSVIDALETASQACEEVASGH